MLTNAYYQIWRPTRNSDTKYCTARNFSKGFFELCSGYAEAENYLRTILTRHHHDISDFMDKPDKALYPALKHVMFELQENYRNILTANGRKWKRSVSDCNFTLLETPMRLSEYTCSITIETTEFQFRPFSSLSDSLPPWYLEHSTVFSSSKTYLPQLTLKCLIEAVGALRCLLYAQFGPESEAAIAPDRKKYRASEGTGYYQLESLVDIQPPLWPEQDWYDITYTPPKLLAVTVYPLELPNA